MHEALALAGKSHLVIGQLLSFLYMSPSLPAAEAKQTRANQYHDGDCDVVYDSFHQKTKNLRRQFTAQIRQKLAQKIPPQPAFQQQLD
ncbi:hypothetical protein GCM10027345_04660 [Hymenobacter daeguensis]